MLPVPPGTFVRDLSLNEGFDAFGRLIQMSAPTSIKGRWTFGIPYGDFASGQREMMADGTTEVWRIANLTGDTHPMHIHLVNWQIISRQPFDTTAYPAINYTRTGPGTRPERAGLEGDGADEPR